jgi:hypothetical protein
MEINQKKNVGDLLLELKYYFISSLIIYVTIKEISYK